MLKTKDEIIEWLKSMKIENYTIRDDLNVDVVGDVNLFYKKLSKIPIQFGIVSKNFYCHGNKIISLEGCPQEVGGDFYCYNNKLTSLKGSPEKVGENFHCHNNPLTSLEYMPKEVGDDIVFSPIKEFTYLDEYKDKDGDILINFNLLKKIIKSHKIKEELENTLIDKNVISKKFKI